MIACDEIRQKLLEPNVFPYCQLEDFLSGELYAGLVENWPDDAMFDVEGGGVRKRRRGIGQDRINGVLANENPFWSTFHTVLQRDVLDVLESVFLPVIKHRFPNENGACTWSYSLTSDAPGNHFGIHIDPPQRVFSALVYLPSPDGRQLAGTTIYREKIANPWKYGRFQRLGVGHYNKDEDKSALFDEVETLPFIENSAFVFANCSRAWHGMASNILDKGKGGFCTYFIVPISNLLPEWRTRN